MLRTDSYKFTHPALYPDGTTEVYSYMEDRIPATESTMMVGLQYYIQEYLTKPAAYGFFDVQRLKRQHLAHFGFPLDPKVEASMIQINKQGYLPIQIDAIPEGLLVPGGTPKFTIHNTEPHAFWLPNYLETLLMKVWYPSTVATTSYQCRKIFEKYLHTCDDPSVINFMLQDFGYRGASSEESAAIGGFAHLVNFLGSDTWAAIDFAEDYYGCTKMPCFSVAASEHTCTIAWGKAHEADMYEHALDTYPDHILSLVADSYDVENAIDNIFGIKLIEKIKRRKMPLVIRLDSGDPVSGVMKALMKLGQKFGTYKNNAGFTMLKYVKILQGDGVNPKSIDMILSNMHTFGWSMANIVFGMGGALLQRTDRDVNRVAIKGSHVIINGQGYPIRKEVLSQPDKASKPGKFYVSRKFTVSNTPCDDNILLPVFRNGKQLRKWSIGDLRNLALNGVSVL